MEFKTTTSAKTLRLVSTAVICLSQIIPLFHFLALGEILSDFNLFRRILTLAAHVYMYYFFYTYFKFYRKQTLAIVSLIIPAIGIISLLLSILNVHSLILFGNFTPLNIIQNILNLLWLILILLLRKETMSAVSSLYRYSVSSFIAMGVGFLVIFVSMLSRNTSSPWLFYVIQILPYYFVFEFGAKLKVKEPESAVN